MSHDEARTWKAFAYDKLEKENAALKERLLDWENREAGSCPEDYPFEDFIAVLRKRNAELEARIAILKSRLNPEDAAIYDK
jgi:hypothetical protein